MKKFYSMLAATALGTALSFAADPVIPESFDVTADSPSVTISQGDDEELEAWTIYVDGFTTQENVKVTFKIPEGWDNIVAQPSQVGIMLSNSADEFFGTKKKSPQKDESEFVPLALYVQALGPVEMGPVFTVPADGEPHIYTCFLLLDDEIDTANGFLMAVTVTQGEAPEVTFPERLDVTADSPNVTINQYIDEDTDALTVEVTGTTDNDDVVLTFNLPEGWGGLIGSEIHFGGMKKAREDWPSLEDFRKGMGDADLVEGNQLVFPADGEDHLGQYFLYSYGQVDIYNGFVVTVNVEKADEPVPTPDPVFPESFNVTCDDPALTITQKYEADRALYWIDVKGETEADEVKLTFDLPEGWAGLIGYHDFAATDVEKSSKKAAWLTIDEYKEQHAGLSVDLEQGTEFVYPVGNGSLVLGYYNLYTDDGRVYDDVKIGVVVDAKHPSGISTVGTDDASVRYYDLQGSEVSAPTHGVYIKVCGGKAEKVRL